MLMRSGKPVVLAVNKCDKVGEPPMELYDFYSLGLGELIPRFRRAWPRHRRPTGRRLRSPQL